MKLESTVFDVWVFRPTPAKAQYKADRYFNGGRLWQIPSSFMQESERVGLAPKGIWAAEHVYTIYNRRFETMQMIAVYAAEVGTAEVRRDTPPAELRLS